MELCQIDNEKSFTVEGICTICPGNIGNVKNSVKKRIISVNEVIPKGLCPFAYFSIIPYWVSFKQEAWFQWRKNKTDVICQCPSTNGVVFLIKKTDELEKVISAEVVDVGMCPYQHIIKQTFQIENDILCPALFPSFWAKIDEIIRKCEKEVKVQCCIYPSAFIIRTE